MRHLTRECPGCTRNRAFTLIEVLVVIGVIGILASLLFPAFAQTREKGRQVSCASNEKQIGFAAALYIQDYNEHYPLGHLPVSDPLVTFDGGGKYESHFIDLLRPYIENNDNQGIWRCPSDPSPFFNIEIDMTEFHVSYSVNGWFEYGQSLATVDSPASKVYTVETPDDDHFHWWQLGRYKANDPIPPLEYLPQKHLSEQLAAKRHSDGANYLFADGHVKWSRLEHLWGTTHDTNDFWP